jgi:hypothetical protein
LWHTSVIPALSRLKQEDHEFQASLGYVARLLPQKKKNNQTKCLFYANGINEDSLVMLE